MLHAELGPGEPRGHWLKAGPAGRFSWIRAGLVASSGSSRLIRRKSSWTLKPRFCGVLTIIRVEDQEAAMAFARAFQETLRKLEPIQGTNRVRWTELVQLIFGWVLHRRPGKERQEWIALGCARA